MQKVLGLIFTAHRDICFCVVPACCPMLPIRCQFPAVAMPPCSDGIGSEENNTAVQNGSVSNMFSHPV